MNVPLFRNIGSGAFIFLTMLLHTVFGVFLYAQQTSSAVLPLVETLTKTLNSSASEEQRLEAAERLAPLLEQIGSYAQADTVYRTAASLAGKKSVRAQRHLLGAVRCALACADVSSADFLLSTAFSSASEPDIKADAKLYALWSWIIKAQSEEELEGPIDVLRTYAVSAEMESVKPAILLTLHHITGEKRWAQQLQDEFPDSPEAAVSAGNARLLPAPFWFFLKTYTAE